MANDREDGWYWVRRTESPKEWQVGNLLCGRWWLTGSDEDWTDNDFAEIGERITREPSIEREMIDASANAVYHMQQVSNRHSATDDQVELWEAAKRLLNAIQTWRPRG